MSFKIGSLLFWHTLGTDGEYFTVAIRYPTSEPSDVFVSQPMGKVWPVP